MPLRFDLHYDPPASNWFTVDLVVGDDAVLRAILDPLFPWIYLTGQAVSDLFAHARLTARPSIRPLGERGYLLTNLQIQQQRIPDLEVRASRAETFGTIVRRFMRADAILGFPFFQDHEEVRFEIGQRRLTLS